MSFAAELNRFAGKTMLGIEGTRRDVLLELISSVIKDTPKDTGLARGNWQTTLDTPVSKAIDIRTVRSAIAEARAAIKRLYKTDGRICFANLLDYIGFLENGWSKQAPAGMVRKNVARFARIVAEKARRPEGGRVLD